MLVTGVDEFDPDAAWVGGDVRDVFTVEFVEELVRRASAAVDALQMLNPELLSNESLEALAIGTEKVRRQVDAAGVGIAGHVDTAQPFRKDGYFSAKALDLRRTQSQRRADALLAMARAAAACPPWMDRPLPLVNYLIDDATFDATLAGERIDPLRYRGVVCRSQSGHELNPSDVVKLALMGHVRRVVYEAKSVIIDMGRKQRLFKGASREAVMLLATCCAWVGCDAKAEWCQADHSISWKQHGPTVPRNGGPLCRRHNIFKEQGFRVSRDEHGDWHTYHPDGHEIL